MLPQPIRLPMSFANKVIRTTLQEALNNKLRRSITHYKNLNMDSLLHRALPVLHALSQIV